MPVRASANRIRPIREARRMTSRELARRVDVDRVVFDRYERGDRDIPAWLAVEVAQVLGVSVEDLAIRKVARSA